MADMWGGGQTDPGLLARLLQGGAFSGLLDPAMDPATQAAAAREAAGATLMARMGKRSPAAPEASPFETGAANVPFAGMLSGSGGFGPAAGVAPTPTPEAPPPPTNDPFSGEPVPHLDGAPLPRPRPDAAGGQMSDAPSAGILNNPSAISPDAASAFAADAPQPAGMAPPNPPAAPGTNGIPGADTPPSGGGILGKILDPANAPMLLAMAGGFAGAPSLGTGARRGFSAAAPQAALARKEQLLLGNQSATVKALVAKGIPLDQAQAAATNPEILKQLLPQAFGAKQRKFTQVGEDMYGNKQFGFVDEVNGNVYDLSGKPLGGGAGAPGATNGANTGSSGNINHELVGEDYLKQYPPEIQAAVKDYVSGRAMPTGNPRAGYTQMVKQAAQKYGQDIGLPADDTSFTARRQMRNQLSSATPSSLGGQINVGNTAMGHLADLSQKALELGNKDWGITFLSHGINDLRGLSTTQAAKVDALKSAAQHYGQEITKFYAGSPGGEAERNRFMESLNSAKTPQELAAVMETEAELMHSRLDSIGSQIKGTLGEFGEKQYPVVRPESQKALEAVAANVDRLRGHPPATPSAAPTGAAPAATGAPPVAGTRVRQNGHTYELQPDGSYKAVQ